MTKILIPTDFSEDATNAMKYALELFGDQDVEYTLMNAYVDLATNLDVLPTAEAGADKVSQKSISKLGNQIRETYQNKSYTVIERLEQGNLSTALDRIAETDHFDYVVMGTKGETADRGWFAGSVAKKTVQDSPFPVIIVPTGATYAGISEVIYTTDLEQKENKVLEQVIDFSKNRNAKVTLLHVDTDVSSKAWSTDELDEIAKNSLYPNITAKELHRADRETAILDYSHENKADLIVLTTSATTIFQKLLHRSVTKEVLMKTDIPLLVFNR